MTCLHSQMWNRLVAFVCDMQVVRSGLSKQAHVVRKPSCARGVFRLIVQTIFAIITVVSFVLIVIMTIKPSPAGRPIEVSRCQLQSCTVICQGAPYYGSYEDDILLAVTDASTKCRRIALELNAPMFENEKLPVYWLSRMRSNIIYELAIKKGNLKYLTCGAFMSQFPGFIEVLTLQDLKLKAWEADSLVGLTNLKTMTITDTDIINVGSNALRAVDDTLQTLAITGGGHWDPINLTGFQGFEEITTVNFSNNSFNNILNNETFIGLERCKMLFLNHCKITSIGPGTFDKLVNMEVLYLNNNYLTYVPQDLFKTIVAIEQPRPRIHLQNNLWYCDCSDSDLRELVEKEILIVEPICVAPDEMKYKTFTEFHETCIDNKPNNKKGSKNQKNEKTKNNEKNKLSAILNYLNNYDIYNDESVCDVESPGRIIDRSITRLLPYHRSKCSTLSYDNVNTSININSSDNSFHTNWTNWLQFSIIVETIDYTMVQLGTSGDKQFGLLWFESTCPNEIYCIDSVPMVFRIYDSKIKTKYTFCPFDLDSGNVENHSCINQSTANNTAPPYSRTSTGISVLAYLITALLCLCCGAAVIYGLIRKNPILLKGSKRIVFVKHKTVDALILPPKIPIRTNLSEENNSKPKDDNIFTVTHESDKLQLPKYNTMKSVRSSKSYSPSYISAVQPSDDQLAEWRVKNHFNNDSSEHSMKSEMSTLSWVRNTSYYSLDENDRTYESLK